MKLEHQNKEKEIVPWNVEIVEIADGDMSYAKWKCINCGYTRRVSIYDAHMHDFNFCPRCGQQKRKYSEKGRCCCDEP